MRPFKVAFAVLVALFAGVSGMMAGESGPPTPDFIPPGAAGPIEAFPTPQAPPVRIPQAPPQAFRPKPVQSTPVVNSPSKDPSKPEPLEWDAINKEYTAKPGELTADFVFHIKNVSSSDAVINWVRPSCGCTVAKLPPTPWKLVPGATGQIELSIDLRGKYGVLSKYVSVDTSYGPKMLGLKVTVPGDGSPQASPDDRTKNMQLAFGDRQIVFRNDCAKCHTIPAIGKKGEDLFVSACSICHDAPHRATMVPDLRALKNPPNKDYWDHWVRHGRVGSLMPAFSQAEGGPLTDDQIDSLVEYLTHYFPPRPTMASATPSHDD